MQSALVDLIDLSLIAKQAYWNIVGPHFKIVHEHLDDLVDQARQQADQIAERAAAIGVAPDGRAGTVAVDSGIPVGAADRQRDHAVVASIAAAIEVVAGRIREAIEPAGKADPVTQDLVIEITAALEKALWMWRVQLDS